MERFDLTKENLYKFNYTSKVIRGVSYNGEPWLVGKDVAEALGYSNTRDALVKHVDEEDKGVAKCDTLGGKQDLAIINESGVYSLIMSSKLPSAKQFKHWVTKTVLPSIRKHGAYITSDVMDRIIKEPKFAIKLLQELDDERTRRIEAEKQNMLMAPKADYCNKVLASPNLINVTTIAKDYGMSAIRFNRLLQNLGIQFRKGNMWHLKAEYQDKNYAQSKTYLYDDSKQTQPYLAWTEKGRHFLYEVLKSKNIVPVSERN